MAKKAEKVMAAGAFDSAAFEARHDVAEDIAREIAHGRQSLGGGGATFIKLDQKRNQLRIAKDPQDRSKPMLVAFRQHKANLDKFVTWLDLGWLLQEDRSFPALVEKVSEADREKVAQFGDPASTLAAAVRAKVPDGKLDKLPADLKNLKAKPFSEGRGMFVAIQDGSVGVLETGVRLYEQIVSLIETNPSIFRVEDGMDIVISTNGKTGLAKQYVGVTPAMDSRGTAEYSGRWPDLVEVLARRVPTFQQKLDFVLANMKKWMDYAGVTKKDLGG